MLRARSGIIDLVPKPFFRLHCQGHLGTGAPRMRLWISGLEATPEVALDKLFIYFISFPAILFLFATANRFSEACSEP
jgi:hypothetical protein